ncbi:hypothetical protein BDF14DRAFT_1726396 [Spinellus fusiger]|nr:hypothetical protein BDF14DRAFT_1726396 [Spinellus fusiger]
MKHISANAPPINVNVNSITNAIASVAVDSVTDAPYSPPLASQPLDLPFYYSPTNVPVLNDQEQYPTFKEFDTIVQDYLQNLSSKKRDKALVDKHRYSLILQVLKDPRNTAISTAQFRFWVKKMFQLSSTNAKDIVCHDNKPVAMREQIYNILVRAHREAHHGGRDKTSALVRRRYSWIPKELIARFVRQCPFCILRRNGCTSPTMSGGLPKLSSVQGDQACLSPSPPCLVDTKLIMGTDMDCSVDTKPFEEITYTEPLWQQDSAFYYQPPATTTGVYMSMAAAVATTAAATAVASSSSHVGCPSTPSSPFDASFYYSQPAHGNGMEFLSSFVGVITI